MPSYSELSKMPADLVVMKMNDFDIILGMEWLSEHHAFINCQEKKVIFEIPNQQTYCFQGIHTQTPVALSTLQVENLRKEVREGYLVSLQGIEKQDPIQPEDILVVRDYPEVFPEELPGLPPVREVEFGIDLIPGSHPIPKAPYRMVPAELEELRK